MRVTSLLAIVIWLAQSKNGYGIPVDNSVEGDPEIECGSRGITINFNTRNPFSGHVFVKTLFDRPECRSDKQGSRVTGIELSFGTCNVQRTRSLNPLGVFVSVTVIITFHPKFITKVDRAFKIQCFYMETGKTIENVLEVSALTTQLYTHVVPMPYCRYEILENPTGNNIQYAMVGQSVFHKWSCDTETTDIFCMIVHSCYVDDGNGDSVGLLDDNGCALDKYLLRNLEYVTDLVAGQETHVFKYADRSQLFFQCQITLTVKDPSENCPIPRCRVPDRGRRRRDSQDHRHGKRNASRRVPIYLDQRHRFTSGEYPVISSALAGTLDVRAEMQSLDIEDKNGKMRDKPIPKSMEMRARSSERRYENNPSGIHYIVEPSVGYCMGSGSFGLMISLIVIFSIATLTSLSMLCFRR